MASTEAVGKEAVIAAMLSQVTPALVSAAASLVSPFVDSRALTRQSQQLSCRELSIVELGRAVPGGARAVAPAAPHRSRLSSHLTSARLPTGLRGPRSLWPVTGQ